MTDTPEDGQADEAGTDDPKNQTPPRTIKVKGGDGEWRELPVETKSTGDPELDSLWEMPYREFDEITKDPDHPLHQKSLQVQSEAFKPIVNALSYARNPLAGSLNIGPMGFVKPFMRTLDTKPWLPKANTLSWVSGMLSDNAARQAGLTYKPTTEDPSRANEDDRQKFLDSIQEPAPHSIDFDSPEPPSASLSEIATAAESEAQEIRVQQLEILDAILTQAQSDSEKGDEALEVAKKSKRASWIAAWAAIGAIIVGIVSIVVTLLQ